MKNIVIIMFYLADLHPLTEENGNGETKFCFMCIFLWSKRKLFHGSTKFLPLIKVCKCIRSLYFELKAWNLVFHCIMYHQIFIKFHYFSYQYMNSNLCRWGEAIWNISKVSSKPHINGEIFQLILKNKRKWLDDQ